MVAPLGASLMTACSLDETSDRAGGVDGGRHPDEVRRCRRRRRRGLGRRRIGRSGLGAGVRSAGLGAGVSVGSGLGAGVSVGSGLGAGVGRIGLGRRRRQGRDRVVGRDGHIAGRVLRDGPEVVGGTRCQVTQRLDMGGVVEAGFLARSEAERRRRAVLELTRGRLIERPRHSRRRRGHIGDFDAHELRLRRVFDRRLVLERFWHRGLPTVVKVTSRETLRLPASSVLTMA